MTQGVDDLKAFLTGSHVYGTPHESSDINLVVFMSQDDLDRLRMLGCDEGDEQYDDNSIACLRFGKLNLLCVTDAADYGAWRSGTDELVARSPVTREEAIAVFVEKRAAVRAARLVSPEGATNGK
jgi:hypothetical protein